MFIGDEIKILGAIEFATIAHAGQIRKNTGIPYICHPIEVYRTAIALGSESFTTDQKIAMILHDVLEDTDTHIDEIHHRFGGMVATLVFELTDTSKASGKNRKERKAMDKSRMQKCSTPTKRIKCWDITCNISNYLDEDKEYAKKYIAEKIEYSDCLKEAGRDYELLMQFLNMVKCS